jgi:hypothetical protein
MDDEEHYKDAVRRLVECCYEVRPDDQGYIIQHRTERDDISHARHLNDLVELADLMEWAEQRRKSLRQEGDKRL